MTQCCSVRHTHLLPLRQVSHPLATLRPARLAHACRHKLNHAGPRITAGLASAGEGSWDSESPFRYSPGHQQQDSAKRDRKRVSTSAASEFAVALPRKGVSRPGQTEHHNREVTAHGVAALHSRTTGSQSQSSSLPMSQQQQPDQGNGSPAKGTSWQYLLALCTISIVICYADRSNISTAVLPMSEQFGWDKAYQGVVLSTFFGGYALTQILGGQLADRLGGKLVLAGGVTLWSLFTFLTPEAAAAGTIPLLATRVLLGVGEGVAFPSIHSLIARNVPYEYQTTAVGIVTAASYAGTALAFGISPYIISNFGWQWVFFLFAGFALLWLPLWLPVTVTDAARISTSSRGAASADDVDAPLLGNSEASTSAPKPSAMTKGGPMKFDRGFVALLKRKEVWAICITQYCQSWGMYGLLNWLPTFFNEYYHVELADLASYTLLPYVVQGGLGAISGFAADKLLRSGWKVRNVRVMLQVVGMLGPAACLVLAVSPLVGATPVVASSMITLGLGFSALSLGGVSASHLDVAPRHAGAIFGAGNTAATLAGLISVPFTGYLLQTTGSWPLVFGTTAAHYVVGSIFWAMWAGDKPLPEDSDEEPVAAV